MNEPALIDILRVWLDTERYRYYVTQDKNGGARDRFIINQPGAYEQVMVERHGIWQMHMGYLDPIIKPEDPNFFEALRKMLKPTFHRKPKA